MCNCKCVCDLISFVALLCNHTVKIFSNRIGKTCKNICVDMSAEWCVLPDCANAQNRMASRHRHKLKCFAIAIIRVAWTRCMRKCIKCSLNTVWKKKPEIHCQLTNFIRFWNIGAHVISNREQIALL